jgi:hypothetical protein
MVLMKTYSHLESSSPGTTTTTTTTGNYKYKKIVRTGEV